MQEVLKAWAGCDISIPTRSDLIDIEKDAGRAMKKEEANSVQRALRIIRDNALVETMALRILKNEASRQKKSYKNLDEPQQRRKILLL
ncbi:hypothetical protein DPMN_052578 [Dreissena polymorpha]|uniref:Uncharacterized protein n=1 Tax=Dreissena polymorpha TaxID=45954 RepID=A0A9D4CJY5_DREPO|nr:hypothetical protein DPMN_052578 [Dreissena polymorpha]